MRSLLPVLCLATGISIPTTALAQSITPAADGTGTQVTQSGNDYAITGGRSSADGANLFHSFEQFGLSASEIATFWANPAVQNILGRVVGGDTSIINGLIQVRGSEANLFLLNPAGVLFGPNAALNIDGGFTATTAAGVGFDTGWWPATGTVDYSALLGNPNSLAFTATATGAIVNGGNLAVPAGESLQLVGGTVINTGTLSASGGQLTVMAVPGENLVRLSVAGSPLSLELATLPVAAGEALPRSIAPLDLPGLLTSNEVAGATNLQVNADGTVSLTSNASPISTETGDTTVSGTLETTGNYGGQIVVLGDRISLIDAALNASGTSGGGTVLVGGNYQGQGPLPHAQTTQVDSDSRISSDALATGNGGLVAVWADEITAFEGTITAQGGMNGGDGGLVETSSPGSLRIGPEAQVNTRAVNGQTGTWLLDPTDLAVVDSGGTATIVGGANSPTTASTIDAATVVTALNGTNVELQADNSISVEAAIAASGNTLGGNLALNAPTANLNQPITLFSGSTLTGTATTVNVGPDGSVQNGVDVAIPGATINLDAATYSESAEIVIDKSLTINGVGSTATLLSGERDHSVLSIFGSSTVALNGLSITQGVSSFGGGIYNAGDLILTNVDVFDNEATDFEGGGIYSFSDSSLTLINSRVFENTSSDTGGGIYTSGDLTLVNSRVTDNAAGSDGGGIYSAVPDSGGSGGNVRLDNSTVADNVATFSGGGIWNGDSLSIDASTISNNVTQVASGGLPSSSGLGGGGIWNEDAASLTITNSTVANNQINGGSGAGIHNGSGAIATLSNSTISGNQANNLAFGGGIATAGTLTVANSTVANNIANAGGGIENISGSAILRNSIVATNQDRSGAPDVSGPFVSQGRNLIGNPVGAGGFSSNDLLNVDPLLGPLANNGGATQTHALLPGSLAINTAGAGATAADQRGVPANGTRDIGAFESSTGSGGTPGGSVLTDPCEADCRGERPRTELERQGNFRGGDRVVLTAEPQTSPQAKADQTEATFLTQFASYFGLPEPPGAADLGRTQQALQAVKATTGQTPAILFVSFGIPALGDGQPNRVTDSEADSLEIILILPTGDPIYRQVPGTSKREVLNTVERLRRQLTDPNLTNTTTYLTAAQQLYNWMIAPIAADLEAQGVNSLSFVMDSGLRLLPVAALHDGQHFLIESYSVSLIPSVNLVDLTYHDVRGDDVLIGGTSQFVTQAPLSAAPVEIALIENVLKGKTLTDEAFTPAFLRQARLQTPYPIIHLATHGAFLRGTPADSYLQFSNGRLKLDQIRQLGWNQPPVELVTLSACQTAIGNPDAELGFAGLAIASGARSAMASLWEINDESTAGFMGEFYQQLQQAPIRVDALRQTQLAMLRGEVYAEDGQLVAGNQRADLPPELAFPGRHEFTHPFYWAAFTLVGSPW